jgi:hypothetical protein
MYSEVVLQDALAAWQSEFSPTAFRRCAETIARLQRCLGRVGTLADIDDHSLERVFASMAADRVSSLVVKRDRRLLLKLRLLAAAGQPAEPDACGA